jgi:hypothetical protein
MIVLKLSFDSVVPNWKNMENWMSLLPFLVGEFPEYTKFVFFHLQAKKVFGLGQILRLQHMSKIM